MAPLAAKQTRFMSATPVLMDPMPTLPEETEVEQVVKAPVVQSQAIPRNLALRPAMIDPIVKVYTVSSTPNYLQPWMNKPQKEATGSGFAISGRRILTNAHVVADQKFVMVRRNGSPIKYPAKVIQAGHECDLALLSVDNEEFWEGMTPLEFGEVPNLQDEVVVAGYPIGGDNISITRGVVSRIDTQQYAHGATNLLAIQIDAAINPGNSGGPAFQDDKVVGVAFQNLTNASSIGFIIPLPIIYHFLRDVDSKTHDTYGGISFCTLGVFCQATDNPCLQRFVQMGNDSHGIVVNRVLPMVPADGYLKKNDVIRAIDGNRVARDGTVIFRGRERIGFDYLISQKFAGDVCSISILRDGKETTVLVPVFPHKPLVPVMEYDKHPSYFIWSGLVFVPLTQPYLHEFGRKWYSHAPQDLVDKALNGVVEKRGQQVVVLSQVLVHDVNNGYQNMSDMQVKYVNGAEVLNLAHLKQLVETAVVEFQAFKEAGGKSDGTHETVIDCTSTSQPETQSSEASSEALTTSSATAASPSTSASSCRRCIESVVFELADSRLLVLDIEPALAAHDQLLRLHRIPTDRSPDLA